MKETISFSDINGEIIASSSKSYMQRAIAISLLSEGITRIKNAVLCNDTFSAVKVAVDLGAEIKTVGNEMIIKGGLKLKNNVLNCGESGLCLRMFSVISSLFDVPVILKGTGSLLKRPVFMIEKPLRDLQVECSTNDGLLPIVVKGPIKPGRTIIDGTISSQFLTGLLITMPLLNDDSEIIADNLKSKPYIDLTLQIIKEFGVNIENENFRHFNIKGNQKYMNPEYEIEGDWSNSAFLLVAGAIGGSVKITGLNLNSKQADLRILEILTMAGADVKTNKDFVEVKKRNLIPFNFDASQCPDLIPPIISLAAHCNGKSVIKGVRRLIYKESNRAEALQKEFSKLGVNIHIFNDSITVLKGELKPSIINPHNDHRIAMAAAVAAIRIKGNTIIENSQCVDKSYPDFFKDLCKIVE
jgi:3-phosphoshikimate 1-carboxyvinyltransferase